LNVWADCLLVSLLRLVKKAVALAREECNKYDLTTAPCFQIGPKQNIMIAPSGGFAVSSFPPICSPSCLGVQWVELQKSK
jgi:hypothetical protein